MESKINKKAILYSNEIHKQLKKTDYDSNGITFSILFSDNSEFLFENAMFEEYEDSYLIVWSNLLGPFVFDLDLIEEFNEGEDGFDYPDGVALS